METRNIKAGGYAIELNLMAEDPPESHDDRPYGYSPVASSTGIVGPTVSPRASYRLEFELNRIAYRLDGSFKAQTWRDRKTSFRAERYLVRDGDFPRKDPTHAAFRLVGRIEEAINKWLIANLDEVMQIATVDAARRCTAKIEHYTEVSNEWRALRSDIVASS